MHPVPKGPLRDPRPRSYGRVWVTANVDERWERSLFESDGENIENPRSSSTSKSGTAATALAGLPHAFTPYRRGPEASPFVRLRRKLSEGRMRAKGGKLLGSNLIEKILKTHRLNRPARSRSSPSWGARLASRPPILYREGTWAGLCFGPGASCSAERLGRKDSQFTCKNQL